MREEGEGRGGIFQEKNRGRKEGGEATRSLDLQPLTDIPLPHPNSLSSLQPRGALPLPSSYRTRTLIPSRPFTQTHWP